MKNVDDTFQMHLAKIVRAMDLQANDETLWAINLVSADDMVGMTSSGHERVPVTIGEAYMQQSLRWLHKVIEHGDDEALKNIELQAKGKE